MTHTQAFRLCTRCVVLYLLFWVLVDTIELPREIMSVAHYWSVLRVGLDSPSSAYFLRIDLFYLAANVFKICLWLCLATIFYKPGVKVQAFFCYEQENSTLETSFISDKAP